MAADMVGSSQVVASSNSPSARRVTNSAPFSARSGVVAAGSLPPQAARRRQEMPAGISYRSVCLVMRFSFLTFESGRARVKH
jgi:hypothetical protein